MPGYEQLIKDFKKLITEDKLSHAYLFFGGDEADRQEKFNFALSLANFLETKKFEVPERLLNELLIVQRNDDEGTIGIDNVRALKYFLYQKPIASKNRVAVIHDAEEMTPEAQNAILKIIEEPPAESLIVFIVRNEESLYPTLVSRLQKIHFPALGKAPEKSGRWKDFSIDDVVENNEIDKFFELLLADLKKDPIKNVRKLKEALRRLTLIKQFNTNKRLQLRVLGALLTN